VSRPRTSALRRRRLRDQETALAPEWRVWIAENLLRGVDPETVIATLLGHGVPRREAERRIAEVRLSPAYSAAYGLSRRIRRLEMIASLAQHLSRTAPDPGAVERRERPSADEFFARYYATGTPVVITDLVSRWGAMGRWSPSYFEERLGDVEVEITTDREADPDYDMHTPEHSRRVRMGDFARRVASAGETNDFYLVANNRNMDRGPLAVLFDDITLPEDLLDPARLRGAVALWFGPGGTVTPLHHDTCNILFGQVYGTKRITLISPLEVSLLDGIRGVYAAFAGAVRKQVDLRPGEALFIPVGYWHHVRSLDVSISLAFTNFRRPNHFDWYKPGAVR
jgi:hypothetical protein